MKLLSATAFVAPKTLLFIGVAIAAIGLPPIALAETGAPRPETASALKCLLDHAPNDCAQVFAGSARLPARRWVGQDPNRDFELGPLLSSEYARTETGDNVYITKLLNGRTTDLYDVKFKRHKMTFYLEHPEADGKIHHMLIRDGGPDDERSDLFVRGPS